MSVIPKRAYILYCSTQPDQKIPNVDNLTLKGCSGQLALEETKEDTTLLQILGLHDNYQIKSRFNDMSLAIISNQKSAQEIAIKHYCQTNSITSIDELLSYTQDVVLIDFTGYDNAWRYIDEFVTMINEREKIICIISPSQDNSVHINEIDSALESIIPRQSYAMKYGEQVDIDNSKSLIYSYSHIGSGRTDKAEKYTSKDILLNGGSSKILAWHLMAEIGHKLGFVPKYGA